MRPDEFDTSVPQPEPAARDESVCDKQPAESRALIVHSRATETPELTTCYRHAPFLAQLVATKEHHPQTRERRRVEPDVALAAYRATAALTA
ncbi:MAG TPA: hypothetical protein VEC94_14850 [Pseudolabrys sp.]|jgi:hypothetical protein|nr:hypothetical protein [Pseudolabrys sp.]